MKFRGRERGAGLFDVIRGGISMAPSRLWLLALAAAWAAAPARGGAPAPPARDDARKLAARIDELLARRWDDAGVRPAEPADDAAFLRRLSLDVAGRIPAVSEVRRFLADRGPDKRARAVENLLDSPAYVNHFTNVWLELLMPEANADFQRRFLLPGIEAWLRQQFRDNVPYDRMVRELLTLPLGNDPRQRQQLEQALFRGGAAPSPLGFYLAKEGRPENLAATTARLFLGVRLECAQCHDHPFGRWTREQFWGQAAFFAGIRPIPAGEFFRPLSEVPDRRELQIPNTERVAQARFLDGSEPRWKYRQGARTTLAEWVTRADNPFFTRAAVNRMWAHFFGIGLVEPVDDMNEDNRPSHPELLDELARAFADHGFDFKFLARALTLSKAYSLDSAVVGPDRPDPRLFTRMAVKGLTPEQLFDSFVQATGYRDPARSNRQRFLDGSPRSTFLAKFSAPEKRTEAQTSIPQALALMNSGLVGEATNLERGELLVAVVNSPFMDTPAKVETLFLATLSRPPRSDEAAGLAAYVDKGGAAGDPRKALADVFWALLNSTEFIFNH
jgi:hypothetical protein